MSAPRPSKIGLGAAVGVLGLFLAPVIWLVFQQGSGALTYFACAVAGPPVGPALGGLAFTCCGLGAWSGWRVAHAATTTEARRFLGWVGAGASALFGLAAGVMTLAMLVVPSCAR